MVTIQDPTDPDGSYLLEALLDASSTAIAGGGVFAWTSKKGLQLLLEDPVFAGFLKRRPFELLIGVDAVTNVPALAHLKTLLGKYPKLRARVFMHTTKGALFHPKLAWFKTTSGGRTIVGSGNLTQGGLRANWEAYTVNNVSKSGLKALMAYWTDWDVRHSVRLFPIDDVGVLARASKNKWKEWSVKAAGDVGELPPIEDQTLVEPVPSNAVLMAELPRAGSRWNQGNFDRESYEKFFGAKVGADRRIILYEVNPDGSLGEAESRKSVEVKSRNYRFELGAAAGKSYPVGGPPIAVFVRQDTGLFTYRLLMPGDPGYAEIENYLDIHWTGSAREMRRLPTTASELKLAWPDSPLLQTANPAD